jgi:capsular polysaccharide biosynthesis protein
VQHAAPPVLNGHGQLPPFTPQPRVDVVAAAKRHWFAAALPVVVLVVLAGLAAYQRAPVFTAETRLAVGRVDPSVPGGLVGFTDATRALAERYSRSVRSEAVLQPVAGAGVAAIDALRAKINAAPVPESPVFRITAKGETAEEAVRLSNQVSNSMVRFAAIQSEETPLSGRALAAYRSASALMAERRAIEGKRRQQDDARETLRSRRLLAAARAEVAVAELRVRILRNEYEASRRTPGPVATVSILEHATGATSDRLKKAQLLLFAAVAVGLPIGLAFAVMLGNRDLRRAAY